MSYILEALRKSSEERTRLTTVGASAEPAPVSTGCALRAFPSPRRSLAVFGVLGLVVVAVGAIIAFRPSSSVGPAAERSPLAALPTASEPTPRPPDTTALAAVPSPKTVPPKKVAVESTAQTMPAKVQQKEPPAPDAASVPAAQNRATSSSPAPAVAVAPHPMPVSAAPVAAPSAGADMPPELMKQVLAVPIAAHVYSSQPAERMVIIEGRAVREGDTLASGMTIEQITPSGIAVSYKGYRANKPVGR